MIFYGGRFFFKVQIDRKGEGISLNQPKYMGGFTSALCIIGCIGIEIDAKGNPKLCTRIGVIFPSGVILGCQVIAVAAADNGKIDVILCFFPFDLSLGLRDIYTRFDRIFSFIHFKGLLYDFTGSSMTSGSIFC